MVERLKFAEKVDMMRVTPRKEIAIIGSGIVAILTAERLLEYGYRVHIIDNKPESYDLGKYRDKLLPVQTYVRLHNKVNWYFDTKIEDFYGFAGNYYLGLSNGKNEKLEYINVGGIVITIGKDKNLINHLHSLIHIDIDDKGYFKPINNDTLCVQTNEQGIMIINLSYNEDENCCHGKSISECSSCSTEVNYPELKEISCLVYASVLRLTSLLNKNEIIHENLISDVDENVCGGCGTCVKTCMFHASKIDPIKKISVVEPLRCKGCGNCVTACPTGAKDLLSHSNKYLFNTIDILSKCDIPGDKVLLMICDGCGYVGLDYAGLNGFTYPVNFLPMNVKCAGRVDTQSILYAFKCGFKGVILCECAIGRCNNIVGNIDLDRRANLFREILKSRGINPERLRIMGTTPCEGGTCILESKKFFENLVNLGGEL